MAEFQELQEFHHGELFSAKFGKITDTKTDTEIRTLWGLRQAFVHRRWQNRHRQQRGFQIESKARNLRRVILLLADVSDSGHNTTVKPIDFHPRALELIRMQTVSIRRQIGEALRDLQKGITPGMPLSRPMSVIAPGVRELRFRDETTTVRVLYATGRIGSIIVFHAFRKKSQKTPMREIDLARRRLREVLDAKTEF